MTLQAVSGRSVAARNLPALSDCSTAIVANPDGREAREQRPFRGFCCTATPVLDEPSVLPRAPGAGLGDEQVHTVHYSSPSRLGNAMRYVWGSHSIVNIAVPRTLRVEDYLPDTLVAFDMGSPDLLTRVKRDVLFCRPVQRLLHHGLAKHMTEPHAVHEAWVPDLFRPNQMHNVIFTTDAVKFTSNKVWSSAVDWVLTKHVLVAGEGADVRFAGELWRTDDNVIHMSRNSGTYRPTQAHLDQAVRLAHVMFPTLRIQAEALPA